MASQQDEPRNLEERKGLKEAGGTINAMRTHAMGAVDGAASVVGSGVGMVGTGLGAGVGLVGSGVSAVGSGLSGAGKFIGGQSGTAEKSGSSAPGSQEPAGTKQA